VPIVLSIVLIAAMISRGRLDRIPTVDVLSLFAAGMAFGVAIVNLLRRQ
jgi:hypothetical protein